MIEEVAVLLRVQDLEQGRGGVAVVGGADLVDLVEHDDRIGRAGVFDRLEELAGHGADVGAPVALDLGLVADAADREAIEAPAECIGDGVPDRGLADTGRADQQDDGAGDLALVDANGQEFQDAFLHILQAVMIAIQDAARALEIQLVGRVLAPGQDRDPVQIVAGDGVFRRACLQHAQLVHLLFDALARLLGQDELFDPRCEAVDLGGAVVLGDAQLLLDRLELLAQKELALLLVHLLLDRAPDLLLGAGELELVVEQDQHLFHARQQRQDLQHLLELLLGRGGEAGREIGEMRRIIGAEAVQEHPQLFDIERVERQQLLDGVDHGHGVGLDLLVRSTRRAPGDRSPVRRTVLPG